MCMQWAARHSIIFTQVYLGFSRLETAPRGNPESARAVLPVCSWALFWWQRAQAILGLFTYCFEHCAFPLYI